MGQNQGITCPLSGCPVKTLLLWTVVVFAIIFGFNWIFHGIYMMPAYEATAALWRSEAAMNELIHICIIRQLVAAMLICALYGFACKSTTCCGGIGKGIRFGLMVGLLLGVSQFGSYAYMPIPLDMAISWLVGETLLGVLIGAALGLMNRSSGATES